MFLTYFGYAVFKSSHIYASINLCTTNFLWFYILGKLGSCPTLLKIKLLGRFFKNGSLDGPRGYFRDPISDLIFFGPSNFCRDFSRKIEGDFNFMVNLFFWFDSF